MALGPTPAGGDPRPAPSDEAAVDSVGHLRPEVAATAAPGGPWLVWGGAAALGFVAFAFLASHRPGASRGVRDLTTPTGTSTAAIAAPPAPPTELDALEAQARAGGAPPPPPPPAPTLPITNAPVAVTPAPVAITPAPAAVIQANPEAARRRAPSLVVDFGEQAVAKPPNGTTAANGRSTLNGDEQFATRVSGATQPDRSRAILLRNQPTTIAQGALIPAVLETALNSDLPGFTRAVVSRDVRSFDGTQVLIPRGSRLIGEYRSGVAQGASRAFVIWTRVLRPDGASIQIGSSGADDLGRAGLAGKVDRHFFERFSGALLLSIINLGGAALTSGNSTSVTIGSSSDSSSLAGAAGAFAPQNISPTIKVPQGTPILVFVARDLDFTPVEPDR